MLQHWLYLLFLHFNFQFFNFISEVLGKFLDLTLDVVLESSPLTSVLHRHPVVGLLGDEEGGSFHSEQRLQSGSDRTCVYCQ